MALLHPLPRLSIRAARIEPRLQLVDAPPGGLTSEVDRQRHLARRMQLPPVGARNATHCRRVYCGDSESYWVSKRLFCQHAEL